MKPSKSNLSNCQPMTPVGHEAQRGYHPPQRKWDPHCTTCLGKGHIFGLKGDKRPCPRCGEEESEP